MGKRSSTDKSENSAEAGGELDAWLEAFYVDSLKLAAAAVLTSTGTLRDAAHRLNAAGFAPPPGYPETLDKETREPSSPEEALRR